MKKQNYEIGFTAETTEGKSLEVVEIKPRISKREGVEVKCGLIYVCDIDGEQKNLTADRLAQAIGTKQASDKAGFTPANAEALERGFNNLCDTLATLQSAYNTKVATLLERYKVSDYVSAFSISTDTNTIATLHDDFMSIWQKVIADNAKAKEQAKEQAKQAKEQAKAIEVAQTLSVEQLELLLAQMKASANESK